MSKRLLKYLLCLLTGIILNGCYTGRLVDDYNPKKMDASRIAKIDFKDGTTVDFNESTNKNQLIKIENGEIVYKNPARNTFTIQVSEIYQIYYKELNPWKTALFIVGMGAGLALTLFKF